MSPPCSPHRRRVLSLRHRWHLQGAPSPRWWPFTLPEAGARRCSRLDWIGSTAPRCGIARAYDETDYIGSTSTANSSSSSGCELHKCSPCPLVVATRSPRTGVTHRAITDGGDFFLRWHQLGCLLCPVIWAVCLQVLGIQRLPRIHGYLAFPHTRRLTDTSRRAWDADWRAAPRRQMFPPRLTEPPVVPRRRLQPSTSD
jgi:hypothetical protein